MSTVLSFALPATIAAVQARPYGTGYDSTVVPVETTLTAGVGAMTVAPSASTWCWIFRHVGVDGATRAATVADSGGATVDYLTDGSVVTVNPVDFTAVPAAVGPSWQAEVDSIAAAVSSAQVALQTTTALAVAAAPSAVAIPGYVAPSGGDDTVAIQAKLDAAGADDIVRLYGTYTIASTVYVKGNLNASGAVFNYSGTGVAVQVGDTTVRAWKQFILPRIINTDKTGTGWGTVAGTTGVKIVNIQSSPMLVIPYVKGFETGLTLFGDTKGVVYNNVFIGHLDNNKVNQKLDANSTGWVNQNTFQTGRFSHNSAEGTNVTGVRHVQCATGLSNPINNNVWLNASFEGDTPEYHLEAAGSANTWQSCRWEITGGGRVWWRADAVENLVLYGYKADQLVETIESGASKNHVLTSKRWKVASNNGVVLENSASSSSPALRVLAAGAVAAGADPDTAYMARLAATTSGFKAAADAADRIVIDGTASKIYFGQGATAATRFIGNLGTTAICIGSGNLSPNADNTLDLGQASFNWRYVRTGTGVQVGRFATGSRPAAATAGAGTMIFDTTLNKPVWSTGSVWVDATGATV